MYWIACLLTVLPSGLCQEIQEEEPTESPYVWAHRASAFSVSGHTPDAETEALSIQLSHIQLYVAVVLSAAVEVNFPLMEN